MTHLEAAAIFFGIGALGGITMGIMLFKGAAQPPAWLSMLHGMLATAGVVLLTEAILLGEAPLFAQMALGAFAVAAAGGVYLNLGFRQKNQPIPFAILGGHAALAILGFLLLIAALLERHS